MAGRKKKHIVVIGGGTGTSVVLEGLKKYPVNLSAIITTADDGSSSGKLRDEFSMIPPGDIRQCLVALAEKDFGYLNERFQSGSLAGHTLGNLLITLFNEKHKNFQEAIDDILRLTGAAGSIIPVTLEPTTLIAKLKSGRTVRGEKNITPSREISRNLKKLLIVPKNIKANPRALEAIKSADVIVVGPGNFYSSIIPNFLVNEISEHFTKSKAKKIYVVNLFTQPGHTDNFSISDFLSTIADYVGGDTFTHIIYNRRAIPEYLLKPYANKIIGAPVSINADNTQKNGRYIGRALVSASPKKVSPSDPIANIRNPFLHDSEKLGKTIMEILGK